MSVYTSIGFSVKHLRQKYKPATHLLGFVFNWHFTVISQKWRKHKNWTKWPRYTSCVSYNFLFHKKNPQNKIPLLFCTKTAFFAKHKTQKPCFTHHVKCHEKFSAHFLRFTFHMHFEKWARTLVSIILRNIISPPLRWPIHYSLLFWPGTRMFRC